MSAWNSAPAARRRTRCRLGSAHPLSIVERQVIANLVDEEELPTIRGARPRFALGDLGVDRVRLALDHLHAGELLPYGGDGVVAADGEQENVVRVRDRRLDAFEKAARS